MKCKYWDCGFCYAPDDVVTSASSQGACFDYDFCPYLKTEMTDKQPEVISSGTAIISDENGVPTKVHLSDKEKLTEMTKKMDSVESIEAEIKMLQSKLEFYKELEKTKSPVEEAYKDWYGAYPTDGIAVDNSWDAFQAGYNAAQKDYKVGEHQEPVKQKDTLYQMLDDESTYGCIGLDAAFKVVKDWLYDNSTIVTEDYSTVTLKLKKGAFGDAN